MFHRRRRRLDLFWLVLGSIGLAVVAAAAAAIGDSERITGYWAGAEVGTDGVADITEVIDYEFGVNPRHGIFRDVPGLAASDPITVSSPTAPDRVSIEPYFDETRIRVGDPNRTITGRHRYTIEYPIGVVFEGDRISWNATGDQWAVSISDIEIHLVAPAVLDDIVCSKGKRGSWGGCTATQVEPGHLVVEVGRLDANEGITVSAQPASALPAAPSLPGAPTGAAPDPGAGILNPALVAVVVGLLAALVMSMLVRRGGREYVWVGGSADAAFGPGADGEFSVRRVDHDELGELATTDFAPPKELSAWQGGVLLAERSTNDHKTAWLVERAIAGEVELSGSGKNVSLSQNPDHPPGVDVLSSMFGGRSTVDLGKYDPTFAAAWTRLGSQLDDWHRDCGLWDRGADKRKRAVRILAGFGLIVGLALLALAAVAANRWDEAWLFAVGSGAVLSGACLAVLIRGWELRVRTAMGSGLWIRVESFRRFLHDSDARHADEAAEKGLLLEYTAWAVAVGEIDRWSRALESSGASQQVDVGAMHLAAIAPSLGRAVSSAATAPSSSGGGGGGSVGGGGGGGGGGSW